MMTLQINRFLPAKSRLMLFCAMLLYSLLMASCAKKPVFINVESVKIGSLKDSILQTYINFKVYNPNSIGSTLTASDVKTYYKGKLVGSSSIEKEVKLPANDTIIIPIVSQLNIWSLADVFPELLATDTAVFRIEGSNRVRALGMNITVPVKQDIKLNVKHAVSDQLSRTFQNDSNFRIKQIRLSRMPGLSKSGFNMVVQVKNSFPFDYQLQSLDLDIYRKGGTNAVANWKMTDTIDQKAGGVANIPIKIEVDNLNLLGEARLSDLFNPKIEVVVKGQAVIAIQGRTFTIPVEENRTVSFNPLTGVSY